MKINWKRHRLPIILLVLILAHSCASTGMPDGGPFDEDPPKFLGSTPTLKSTNNNKNKITLDFDELVKLENASEKVIVSPPQSEQAEIKVIGKKIVINLLDTLKDSVTYTVDFSDAIVDNHESNPMGNFTYSFSTYDQIDTMEVSGTVLNAENLEPIKGMLVGLHADLHDSAFSTKPFDRVARTDSRGFFVIRGVAADKIYRIYALNDGNQNYLFDSKTELIAFSDSLIVPSMEPATRPDTIWTRDSLIDSIRIVPYTHFMPDNITLRAFKETNTRQYLKRATRTKLNQFELVFSAKADSLPLLKGLNFDEQDAFVVESPIGNDSITYWIRDSLLAETDSLILQLDYQASDDSTGLLMPRTDTIYLVNKINKERRLKLLQEELAKKEKERKKRLKKGDSTIVKEPMKFLEMRIDASSSLDLGQNVKIRFDEPLARFDTSVIKLNIQIDTLWQAEPFIFRTDSIEPRTFELLAAWKPEAKYQLLIDSAAAQGIYGLCTKALEQEFSVKKQDEYATLLLNIIGAPSTSIVQLLDNTEKVIKQEKISDKNTADFYFLAPGQKYYVRLINDRNQNGKWDTGEYSTHCMPEEVYYFPKTWEMKANFEFEETWNIHSTPLEQQKLEEIKKQKAEEKKKQQDRNRERLKRLGRLKE